MGFNRRKTEAKQKARDAEAAARRAAVNAIHCFIANGNPNPSPEAQQSRRSLLAVDGKQLIAVCHTKPLRRLHCIPFPVSASPRKSSWPLGSAEIKPNR
jgi:hypothetical protein